MPQKLKPKDKWKFAIGTTSRVPQITVPEHGQHYFICDIDGNEWSEALKRFIQVPINVIVQKTQHGWHIYTDWKMSFSYLVTLLNTVGADPAWVRIGEERGYYFLADKSQIYFPWPVEHMVLHYEKKKA